MTESVTRFSNRVENYIKYRPDYPREIVPYLTEHCGLTSGSIVADVGCGPGVSSRMFLENGNHVIGIEPNDAMRNAAKQQLAEYPNFTAVNGSSDNTSLPDNSVDLVVAAQAFHWFEPEPTRKEFRRILKPGRHIVLMWNERQLDSTPFLKEYESFLLKHATDYTKVRHENVDDDKLSQFFAKPYFTATFSNIQIFDLDGLLGRIESSSYMPNDSGAAMMEDLQILFAKHEENGKIKIFYDTNVYHSSI